MLSKSQPSFISGELSPSLHARVDLVQFHSGLSRCRNFIIHPEGGASNRPGMPFVVELKNSGKKGRLIPFSFNTTQTYILQFEDKVMRVIKSGGQVLVGAGPVIFELVTPYLEADLPNLKYSQSADVMTITHPSYQPRDLARTAHDVWTLTIVNFTPTTAGLTVLGANAVNLGKVVSIATNENPIVITATAHGFLNGDEVFTGIAGGMTEIGKRRFIAAAVTPDTFELQGEDGTSYGVYTGGMRVGKFFYGYKVTVVSNSTFEEGLPAIELVFPLNVDISAVAAVDLTWSAVSGAKEYRVYRAENGLYGLIGISQELYFKDKGEAADFTESPPDGTNPFAVAGDYPSAFTYHQQRKIFASTNNDRQKIFGTRTGNFKSMDVSFPVKDDDAISFVLNSNQVNEIRHLISLGSLIALTSGSEWSISGSGQSNAITPSSVQADQQSYYGASHLRPLVIGQTVLFVQEKGSLVHDLTFSFETNGYTGKNLSILASHLFRGKTIIDWTYSKIPDSIVWVVLSDGSLAGLTYIKEQDVLAWHRHDTDGEFESVASISEGNEDAVYFIVKRTVNGATKRYVERMSTRISDNVRDAFFVDSGVTLDAPLAIIGATLESPVIITSTAHGFINGDLIDISDIKGMTEINLNRYRAANATTNTFELTHQYSGVNINGSSFTPYLSGGKARKAVTTITGLTHLDGKTVSVLADGNDHPSKVVSSGSITLDYPASRVHVGLPITADLETLNINFEQTAVQHKKKNVSKVTIQFEESRFPKVGPNEDFLTPMKQRDNEGFNDPINLFTGLRSVIIRPEWNTNGRVFIRHTTPLPLSILSIIPEVRIGDQ